MSLNMARIPSSLRTAARRASSDSALRQALAVFVVMRVVLSLWAALVLTVSQAATTPDDILRPYQGVEPVGGGLAGLLLGVWQRFDSLWYLRIAQMGYSPNDGTTVYFPLYPLLVRLVGKIMLGNYLLAAIVISNVAYIALLFCLYKLTEAELGRAAARRSTIYLAVFPTAFFFIAAYAESLFLALTLSSFLCAFQKRWWMAAVFGSLASLTRLQGIVLVAPLLYIYLRDTGPKLRKAGPELLGVLVMPCGAFLFLAYQRLVLGSAGLTGVYQSQLHAQFVWPWDNVIAAAAKILSPQGTFINVLNLSMTVVFLIMTVVSFRRLGMEYGIYMAVTMTALLLRRTTLQPLVSMSRYVLALFPAFMLWGLWGRNPNVRRLIIYPSVALLLYLSGQFAIWGWVG
jgi:hypothetical protein